MNSQKVVTPVKTGVQRFCNDSKKLDSGFRRNDGVFFTDYSLLQTGSVFRLPTISLIFRIPFSVQ